MIGEMNKRLELLRKFDPPAIQKHKSQTNPRKTTANKSTSMSIKLHNTPPDSTNMSLTSDILVSLPTLDYNIMEDMRKACANISLFELAKIQGQRDIILHALGKTSANSTTSTSKGSSTSPGSLTTVINTIGWKKQTLFSLHSCFHLKFLTAMFTTVWLILVHQPTSCHYPLPRISMRNGARHLRRTSN